MAPIRDLAIENERIKAELQTVRQEAHKEVGEVRSQLDKMTKRAGQEQPKGTNAESSIVARKVKALEVQLSKAIGKTDVKEERVRAEAAEGKLSRYSRDMFSTKTDQETHRVLVKAHNQLVKGHNHLLASHNELEDWVT